ncbi:mechanosensitive ion channel family protein [Mucilaginibacter sp. FT3.2]|uniref:mechanosensitive ion channel family protein n=1 Tax=Mucilaginibacter sp. FT3.2 TaxID=2723090 RepID=UPI0016182870|nr:mechanosensitive ion channel domain-containing protein [Mucilaginibacter sp. FT3.2]MBB6231112.1 small-conductance mechanosensitive channel [Mucilaginibacter sp. FT3.2]
MMRNLLKLSFIILIAVQAFTQDCAAQAKKRKGHLSMRDSLRAKVLRRDSVIRSFKNGNGSVNILLGKIEDYTTSFVETNSDLSRGFDTLEISQQLPPLEKRMGSMRNTIDKSSTLSNLVTIRGMIDHLKDQMNSWEDEISVYNDQLDDIRNKVSDFKADTGLRSAPADSSLRVKCFIQIQDLDKKWKSLDSSAEKSIVKIGLLENRVSALSILLIDLDDRIDLKIHDFTIKALTNEYGFIWNMDQIKNSAELDTALSKTVRLSYLLYAYFLTNKANFVGHVGNLLILVSFFVWIYSSRKKIARTNTEHNSIFDQTNYIVKYPYLSALTLFSIVAPYLYNHPSQAFVNTMLLTMMASMGLLIKNNWPRPLFKLWAVLFIAAFFYCISSLMVMITYADRIVLLLISGSLIYYSIQFLKQLKLSADQYPPYIKLILKVFIGLQTASALLNITGRFSLAKIVGVSATLNICLAMGFYLLLQILMESLFLQLEGNKKSDNSLTSFLDFKELQKKSKGFLVKITGILWLVALAKNLAIDDFLYDQANDFLNSPHKVSSTAFTFKSILVFIVVIWISGLVARIISYFYDFAGQQTKLTPQAKKTRSSILLIRLTIFVVGFFVAITAAGIPMDRVTIVIGALGVGIGFGLQNIVNNLVSGVILAFEKPVQVGDIIEVSGKSGTIKEIGIRSSKIECGDGSELIVPNGDLISQHVVNWTLTNNNRRVELIIRVAYGSDVIKVEDILNTIIKGNDDIMKTPAPSVFLNNFSDSAIEFRALFWAAEISKWQSLKSGVMRAIYIAFDKEGVEIPQGQKDIQVNFPGGFGTEQKPGNTGNSNQNPPGAIEAAK